jgi:hypothetical protein
MLAVSNPSAAVRRTSSAYEYSVGFTVREMDGQTGATLGTVELTLFKDGNAFRHDTADVSWPAKHVNAGGSVALVPVVLVSTGLDQPVATRVDITVNFVDDVQKSGVASAAVDVAQPAAPAQTYLLSCIVQDDATNAPLADARVEVVTGPDAGASTTSSSAGLCAIPGLQAGTITVRVTRSGYQTLERSVTLPSDTRVELKVKPVASPNPPSPPSPNPPTPNPPSPPSPPTPTDPMICSANVPSTVACGTPTARCNDGTYSCSQNRSGTCSSHDGVSCWVCPGVLCQGVRNEFSPRATTVTWR